jgi:hypothetical protein
MKNTLLSLLILLGFAMAAHGQADALQKRDASITAAYKTFLASSSEDRYDKTGPEFLTQMKAALLDPVTFGGTLDSLKTYITIQTSPDQKVKFYSWDALDGGTWHNFHCFAQFQGADGKVHYLQIDTGDEDRDGAYTDSEIIEVLEIQVQGQTFYLTRAWGTHGSGMQHQFIQVYRFIDGSLVHCESCMGEDGGFAIEYPRSSKLDFVFDPMKNQISYQILGKQNAQGQVTSRGDKTTFILSPHIWLRD